MDKLTDEQLDILFKELPSETPSVNFSDKVMNKIEETIEERKVIDPLIGKSTWFLLFSFFLSIIIYSFIQDNPSTTENGLSNLAQYGKNIIDNLTSIWVYIALGCILLWEFIVRRQLNLI